jgi:glutamate-1-semialdehyde aminotransferase
MSRQGRAARELAREWPAELQLSATNGNFATDSRGRKYIDFVMGWCVGNFGWRPASIVKAIERFKGPDYVYPGYSYAPWTELARLLASLAPRPLTTCFRATGGSEAVDLALQAAMAHTGRRALLSLEGSYHGRLRSPSNDASARARVLSDSLHSISSHAGRRDPDASSRLGTTSAAAASTSYSPSSSAAAPNVSRTHSGTTVTSLVSLTGGIIDVTGDKRVTLPWPVYVTHHRPLRPSGLSPRTGWGGVPHAW